MDRNRNMYSTVMSRVYNKSRSSLDSRSFVTRHNVSSTVRFGAKVPISNVSSGVYSELPTVLHDYVPIESKESVVKRSFVNRPKKTLKSLNPVKPPTLPTYRIRGIVKPGVIRGSAPSLLNSDVNNWSESHVRQCYSSRSHRKLKQLKDEINAYREQDKVMRLRARLYKSCGVVVDDVGLVVRDRAMQVNDTDQTPKEDSTNRFPQTEPERQAWIEATGQGVGWLPNRTSLICSVHFPNYCFHESDVKTSLKPGSVPTLNLVKPILAPSLPELKLKLPNPCVKIETNRNMVKPILATSLPELKLNSPNPCVMIEPNPNVMIEKLKREVRHYKLLAAKRMNTSKATSRKLQRCKRQLNDLMSYVEEFINGEQCPCIKKKNGGKKKIIPNKEIDGKEGEDFEIIETKGASGDVPLFKSESSDEMMGLSKEKIVHVDIVPVNDKQDVPTDNCC